MNKQSIRGVETVAASEESVRMPLLGRTLVHEEGVQLFEEWINSLTPPCN